MLRLTVGDEGYDESTQEFVTVNPVVVELEHSLISLSKWESKHQRPFLSPQPKTPEEVLDYVWDMVVTPGLDRDVLEKFSPGNFSEIQSYIDSPYSATTIRELPGQKRSSEVITSELIYYWMVAFTIPFECETWHLNRLFALIKICSIKNSKQEPMSRHDAAVERARLNAERRERLGTRG